MRQFVTWQFWVTIAALVGLTVGLWVLVRDDSPPVAASVVEVDTDAVPEGGRRIDVVLPIYGASADPGFDIVDGKATASMQLAIDGYRTVMIAPGTPGENRCDSLDQIAGCAVAADLLGESVMWFSILPRGPRDTVVLPAPLEFQDGDRLLLANGWSVAHAPKVKRTCAEETGSLGEFMETFGDAASSSFGFDEQAVVGVTCDQ